MPATKAKASPPRMTETVFVYARPDESPAFEVVRFDWEKNGERKKDCRVRYQPSPGRYVWKKPNENWPYRLPEVIKAQDGSTIYIVEGEPKVEAIRKRGGVATCNAFGQGSGKWKEEWNVFFVRKRVVLLPDNDEVGKAHMARIYEMLKPLAREVVYIELPDLGESEDVVDYFAKGHTFQEMEKFIADAQAGIIEAKVTPLCHGDAYEPVADRKKPKPPRRKHGLMLNEVTREEIRWMWRGRIPIGSITMLDGDPGCGKSNIAHFLAAVVSAGLNFPDGDCYPESGVILIDCENGPTTTILPRIQNNGGDVAKVKLLTTLPTSDGKSERLFSFPDDLDILAEAVEEIDAKLVIVDTIMNHLGGDVQSRNDQDVRRALTPLSQLASKMGFAVLILRHLNKSAIGPALYRGAGSIGFIGVARVGLIVGNDPDTPTTKILAVSKINDWKKLPSLKYQLRGHTNGSSYVEWLGESDHDADGVLAAPTGEEDRTVVEDGTDVLNSLLESCGMPVEEIKRHAKEAGISESTLRRAKAILGVEAYREGGLGATGRWVWCLKKHRGTEHEKPKVPTAEGMGTLAPDSPSP